LAACGGGSTKPAQSGSVAQTVKISEAEYSLTPAAVSLSKPGTYEFQVLNNGRITHALEVEGNGIEAKTGHIQAASSATLRVTLAKGGSYEMYCPIDGHKGYGMRGTITVGGASGAGGTTTEETTTSRAPGY